MRATDSIDDSLNTLAPARREADRHGRLRRVERGRSGDGAKLRRGVGDHRSPRDSCHAAGGRRDRPSGLAGLGVSFHGSVRRRRGVQARLDALSARSQSKKVSPRMHDFLMQAIGLRFAGNGGGRRAAGGREPGAGAARADESAAAARPGNRRAAQLTGLDQKPELSSEDIAFTSRRGSTRPAAWGRRRWGSSC